MGALGAVLVGLGIIGLIYGLMNRFKAGRIASAPLARTGDAARGQGAGEKGALAVEGALQAAQWLTAPASGKPCLYYQVEATAKWKEGESSQSEKFFEQKMGLRFTLDDGSGPVAVDASKGGDFDPMETSLQETKKLGLLSGMKSAFTGEGLLFGQFQVPQATMNKFPGDAEFTVVERLYAPQGKLFALGAFDPAQGGIGSPGWSSLLLSTKSREELLGASAKTAKVSLSAGGAAVAVGSLLGLVSRFVG